MGKSTLVNTLFKSKVSRKSCTPSYEEKISKTVKLHSVSHSESTHIHTQVHATDTHTQRECVMSPEAVRNVDLDIYGFTGDAECPLN